MAQHKVYTFYAALNDYEPKIWRRFEITGGKTMAELAYAIMIMFEMRDFHLFSLKSYFRDYLKKEMLAHTSKEEIDNMIARNDEHTKNIVYEFPYDGDVYLREDERLVLPHAETIQSQISTTGMEFLLAYDYGDSWQVSVVVENIRKEEISLKHLPRVLEGQGYGIVEDVGGVYGLTELANILRQGKGEAYDEMTRWLDSTTLDLESFDQEDMNFRLKKIIRIYSQLYQDGYEPTELSCNLLSRQYLGKGHRGY